MNFSREKDQTVSYTLQTRWMHAKKCVRSIVATEPKGYDHPSELRAFRSAADVSPCCALAAHHIASLECSTTPSASWYRRCPRGQSARTYVLAPAACATAKLRDGPPSRLRGSPGRLPWSLPIQLRLGWPDLLAACIDAPRAKRAPRRGTTAGSACMPFGHPSAIRHALASPHTTPCTPPPTPRNHLEAL